MKIDKGSFINDFIDKNLRQYSIPVYQRNYEWSAEQCEKLFEDIIQAHKLDRYHFTGSVVYSLLKTENKIDYYIIIDGQQRLTTIYILLKALIDAINEAINAGKKIAFQYFAYNVRKQKKLRHDGERYIFSPYRLIWNGDYYYVLGYSDKHQAIGSFRVDRISARPDILSEDAVPVPEDFDVDDFLATTFRMYGSECQEVELICDNSVIDAIIDRFGTDVTIYAYDMSTFRVIVRVAVSHIFFSWIFGFGGKVRIKGPEKVEKSYLQLIKQALTNY